MTKTYRLCLQVQCKKMKCCISWTFKWNFATHSSVFVFLLQCWRSYCYWTWSDQGAHGICKSSNYQLDEWWFGERSFATFGRAYSLISFLFLVDFNACILLFVPVESTLYDWLMNTNDCCDLPGLLVCCVSREGLESKNGWDTRMRDMCRQSFLNGFIGKFILLRERWSTKS